MRGCITLHKPRIFGAALHIHWAVLVAGGILFGAMIKQPLHAALFVCSYFGVMLLHEAGHAFVARRLGCRPSHIYLTFIHGHCECDLPDSLREHAMLAWGGVLAQLAVAMPLLLLGEIAPLAANACFGILLVVFGYFSLSVVILNLMPAEGLDGALAWRLVPMLVRDIFQRHAAKKAAKEVLRRFK
ncbi:MAG: hypothetical protein ABIT83_13195 [Massilia sp.]